MKGNNMANKNTQEEALPPLRTGDPRLSVKEPEMNDEAFSIAKDKDGRFFLVTLKYDLESGVGKVEHREVQSDRGEAFQRLKIAIAQSGIMG